MVLVGNLIILSQDKIFTRFFIAFLTTEGAKPGPVQLLLTESLG